jgi:hypothetical protein
MPGWKTSLKAAAEMWQVTTFLSHMEKLPPTVQAAWKATAGGAEGGSSADAGAKTEKKDKMDMPAH